MAHGTQLLRDFLAKSETAPPTGCSEKPVVDGNIGGEPRSGARIGQSLPEDGSLAPGQGAAGGKSEGQGLGPGDAPSAADANMSSSTSEDPPAPSGDALRAQAVMNPSTFASMSPLERLNKGLPVAFDPTARPQGGEDVQRRTWGNGLVTFSDEADQALSKALEADFDRIMVPQAKSAAREWNRQLPVVSGLGHRMTEDQVNAMKARNPFERFLPPGVDIQDTPKKD